MSFSFRGRNIVCFSTADWDTLLPTNKHQLMRRLAAKGSRVLFVETLGTRAPKMGSGTDLSRIGRRLARGMEGPKRRERRLWTISPVVLPKWNNSAAITANQAAFRIQSASALRKFSAPIAWIYSPYACYLLDGLKPSFVVYHMVDDLSAVPGADASAIREAEARMLSRADIVFCTERSLYDRARRIARRAHFMPNVADYAHFSRPGEVAATSLARMKALSRPRIVFSGNLAPHKVDLKLIGILAAERTSWQFVLIGPEWEGEGSRELEVLRRRENVCLLGHVPYEQLPAYLHEADVLIIPYRQNDATRAVSPLKLFEYMATGRPVVSSPLPSVLPYSPAVTIAESESEWIRSIEHALSHAHEMEAQRRALARRHTWEKRVREMEAAIGAAMQT